jgi:hypothetical protein
MNTRNSYPMGFCWLPPSEYRSQRQQDRYEPAGGLQLPSTRPQTLESEWQHKLWDEGIRCDVILKERRDNDKIVTRIKLCGPLRERLLARPLIDRWINGRRGWEYEMKETL